MFTDTFAAMTTQCQLTLHGVSVDQGRAISERIQLRVAALVQRYNFHAAHSWLSTAVNTRRQQQVEIDDECAAVLSVVREHAERTQGAFDITVGTYAARLRLARDHRDVVKVREQLARYTGHQRWWVQAREKGHTLCFDNPCTRLDLGGVIKEFAVDESVRIAQSEGVCAGIVNYGGDLRTWGLKPDQSRFVAAIPDPRQPERMLFGLDLQDQALTTSGHYARQRPVTGGVLSHVVSPAAGFQGQRWLSASVVSPSTLLSGIYSTALLLRDDLVLPPHSFAVVVDREGRVHTLHPSPSL